MDRNYGLNRVLEPKGVVPATAWKVDNSRTLFSKEARVSLERIHLEWGNFQQICTSSGYDENKIRSKILDLVEKRGKLHNPFIGSGGVLIGTVEEIAEDLTSEVGAVEGDRIYCIASLSSIPVYIEEIHEIDFNYGQIVCSGYAILFETSPVHVADRDLSPDYTLAAIDEAGSLFGAYNIALEHANKKLVIIGRTVYGTLLYAAALKEAGIADSHVTVVMDEESREGLSQKEIRNVMKPLVGQVFFTNLAMPVASFEALRKEEPNLDQVDQIIVAEDIFGAETLAVLMIKPFGDVYFTSVENHYGAAQLAAESLGKMTTMYAFDQYLKDYPQFTLRIVRKIRNQLEEINRLYEKKNQKKILTKSQAENIMRIAAGKEDDFVYQSKVTKSMIEEVMNVAKYDCNVIIQGETGVGKEKILSLIHQNSDRCLKPCVKINCATIAEGLAESEFFGYEAGAFTGAASSGKTGYFELADGGILFLDEIGTLSMNMQSKLLRVLQENQFFKVGGTRQISVNVRVIVANNVPLKDLVEQGTFREDLYYRLNICKIDVPALRERKEDVLCLAQTFADSWTKKYRIHKELSPEALGQLYKYHWPGNVRELENVMHRLIISSRNVVITAEDVDEILNENAYGDMMINIRKSFEYSDSLDFHQLMNQQEKQIIEYALKKEGTTRRAAELLGLPQTTLARKKLKYGL